MRLPTNVSGDELVRRLARLGYAPTRQSGSHQRLTTTENGQHHVTVPLHRTLKVGTLRGILTDVADHFEITRDEVAERLWDE